MKTIITLVVCALMYCAAQFGCLYYKERKEKNRVVMSLAASTDSLHHYRAKNNMLVAKSNAMQLKYDELKTTFPEIIQQIKNLNVNPKQVNSYSQTVIHQEKELVTHLRDSVIHDTIHARVFDYKDDFYTVKGVAVGDSQHVSIASTDSLIQLVYRGERVHPWLWIFSPRKLQQVIASTNPNNRIQYNRTIQIVK